MIDLGALLLRRADEQTRGLPTDNRTGWQPSAKWRDPLPRRRPSMKNIRCRCGAPATKKSKCHRCYMAARRIA